MWEVRLICFVTSLSLLFQCLRAQECTAPPDTDFDREPNFWCSLDAVVYITDECTTRIEEFIESPWAHGRLVRYIPHQKNQVIKEIRAFNMKDGLRTSLSVTAEADSANTNTAVIIRAPVSKQAVQIALQYQVENGVELFRSCEDTSSLFTTAAEGAAARYQLVKWSSGGKSAGEIKRLGALFSLTESPRMTYVEAPIRKPSEFDVATATNSSFPSEQIRVSHRGNSSGLEPASIMFYFVASLTRGSAICANTRNCEREAKIAKEKYKSDGLTKVMIGLGVALGVLVTVVGIGLWISCCKSLTKRKTGNMDNLPLSLRHFAYDTGDDKQNGQRRQWTKGINNTGRKEYLAIDLSPGNQLGSTPTIEQPNAKVASKDITE
ncbi:hypothetical protein BWQ96_03617 [Gracilariopsis chorda]|uniref:Uncharacterized protein n=1 Tax=Gracilariopsis chorda TaxID=448386 RepID=A0A2V3IWV2_9FLOR|nr:hypothetical protein BWQ96_03617 [Gracilariopsis chorda]|eukprot:PXF46628.1 hypothetical protein BWQ96_03617 [Gracilariopsis chorda]